METIRKNIVVIFSTLLLLGLVFFIAGKEDRDTLYFQVQSHSDRLDITIFDAENGNYYVFLPSYASLDQLRVVMPFGQEIFLDDIQLTHKMSCDVFELERPYRFSVEGRALASLWFYQSRNVATMHIDTVSGDMTQIHEDKNFQESASMTLHLPDGTINYIDNKCKLKGRGNATWDCEKRPYLLTLSDNGNLLDMGRAKKWVLLANAYDETNLNNKLAFDLASSVGFAWSPECQYVDLYLNGEYRGLYLLTEKIEIHPERLDLSIASGDYLCMLELITRRDELEQYLESYMGRIVEICTSNELSISDREYLSYLVYLLERDVISGEDLKFSKIMDLDSWVRRYLIDEISGNIDSDITSSFFYFSDGKCFAGPVWDYDMAFGNHARNRDPYAFIAKNEKKTPRFSSPYYNALWNNDSFYQRMLEVYSSEFVPILQEMIDYGIDDQQKLISASSRMNSIRWRRMYDAWLIHDSSAGKGGDPLKIKDYLHQRVQFLNSAWLENKEFCTIQFLLIDGTYGNISVEKGTVLDTSCLDLPDTVWVDVENDIPIDFQIPITRDMVVKPQPTP